MKSTHTFAAAAIAAAAILSGCAAPEQQYNGGNYPQAAQPAPAATSYGVVDTIQVVAGTRSSGLGAGAVVGGVVGGLLGNQVGGGNGKTAATVVGAVGGAVVGNEIQQRNRVQSADSYHIGVRMDNGTYQSIAQESLNGLQVGSRARIDNGRVYQY
jgi:outer membrane lipoprotein SlyB